MSNSNLSKSIELLSLLKFELKEDDYWTKSYYNMDSKYELKVQLHSGEIIFPEQLVVHHKSTSKLSEEEDFVVFECVDRLLTKGYRAEKIELEKTWALGRKKEKGRLDILVRCKDSDDIYLMIECKTYDSIDGEIENTLQDGGQLFSYFQQDRSAKFLCLYASWVEQFNIPYVCKLVPVTKTLLDSRNLEESYSNWDKQLKDDGVFDVNIPAYQIASNS